MDKRAFGQNGRIRVPPAALALAAAILLALGAAALASAHGTASHGMGPLAREWWLFALAAVVIGVVSITKLRHRMYSTEPESTAQARLHRGMIAVIAVATAAVPVALFLLRGQSDSGAVTDCPQCTFIKPTGSRASVPAPPLPTGSEHTTSQFKVPISTIVLVMAIILAALVVTAVLVVLFNWWSQRNAPQEIVGTPPAMQEAEEDESALGLAVLAGRNALEGEARAAIIACYAAMESSLSAAGVPRLESDSPADLLARALSRNVVSGPAPRLLADLFREARFSTHAMGAEHLEQARGALDEITAQLTERQEAQAAEAAASVAGTGTAVGSP